QEQLGQRPQAIRALQEALEEVPDNAAVLALLRRYLLEEQRHAEAAAVLAREADVARERATEYARRMQRGELLRDRLDDPRGAVEDFEKARALLPQDPHPLLELIPLYRQLDRREALVDALEARAVLDDDDAAAAELLTQAGALNRQVDPARAAV